MGVVSDSAVISAGDPLIVGVPHVPSALCGGASSVTVHDEPAGTSSRPESPPAGADHTPEATTSPPCVHWKAPVKLTSAGAFAPSTVFEITNAPGASTQANG